jgi:hypothetical protein
MKIIIGSTALQYFNFNRKEPKDLDIWVSDTSGVVAGDCKVIPLSIMELIPTENGYATPDAIYTIKCSHLGWTNPMWDKHKLDVLFLKNKGCVLLPELYDKLVEYWKLELGDKSFLSLKQDKGSFFTDNVTYYVDHDTLHEMVSYPRLPMYNLCLKQGEDVLIDKDKFDNMSFENQVRMFREEIAVIAIERWLLPSMMKCGSSNIGWYKAYILSLKKTITSLTKNWATSFIVLNLECFIKPDYTYFEYALGKLENKEENL